VRALCNRLFTLTSSNSNSSSTVEFEESLTVHTVVEKIAREDYQICLECGAIIFQILPEYWKRKREAMGKERQEHE